jgi:hypothetical protein
MLTAGAVISYLEICREEGVKLRRGMNYKRRPRHSVILMSLREGAPYADRIEEISALAAMRPMIVHAR